MCGIFGVVASSQGRFSPEGIQDAVKNLFLLSESRGKEASGIAISFDEEIHILKQAEPASSLIRGKPYRELLEKFLLKHPERDTKQSSTLTILGHSRLVTNGSQEHHNNNQPIITSGTVGIHNGIIVNDSDLWKQFPEITRAHEVDTEVLLSLIRHFISQGETVVRATQDAFALIQGAASIAVLFEDLNYLLLATNNGSLYTSTNQTQDAFLFASESFILQKLLSKAALQTVFPDGAPLQVRPGNGYLLNLNSLEASHFSLHERDTSNSVRVNGVRRRIVDSYAPPETPQKTLGTAPAFGKLPQNIDDCYHHVRKHVSQLRRCSRCILPETMPFISFDEQGVCSYCRAYQPIELLGHDAFEKTLAPHRKSSGEPDCVVAFSGGRDSSYGLHYIKAVLGMNPLAYTYDWGMVTDLARRNISRMCGQLGVEHILISADLRKKRDNVRKNVSAWLKKPDLGLIPLFMAGDKQFFYHANKLKEQYEINAIVFSENRLETTNFKTGFLRRKA